MKSLASLRLKLRAMARREDGASMVEFALVAPFLIFMAIGLIEIGRFATLAIVASNAARAGVQYGAQDIRTAEDTTGITSAALKDGLSLSSFTNPSAITVSTLCSVNGGTPQTCAVSGTGGAPTNTIYYVKVQVTGTFNSLLKYPGIPLSLPVSGSAMMRVGLQ